MIALDWHIFVSFSCQNNTILVVLLHSCCCCCCLCLGSPLVVVAVVYKQMLYHYLFDTFADSLALSLLRIMIKLWTISRILMMSCWLDGHQTNRTIAFERTFDEIWGNWYWWLIIEMNLVQVFVVSWEWLLFIDALSLNENNVSGWSPPRTTTIYRLNDSNVALRLSPFDWSSDQWRGAAMTIALSLSLPRALSPSFLTFDNEIVLSLDRSSLGSVRSLLYPRRCTL